MDGAGEAGNEVMVYNKEKHHPQTYSSKPHSGGDLNLRDHLSVTGKSPTWNCGELGERGWKGLNKYIPGAREQP